MVVHHHKDDIYMLQQRVQGTWHDVRKVRKQGGTNSARAQAQSTGNAHRVINLSKGSAVLVHCEPK